MNSDTVVLFFFREGVHFLTYEKKAQGVVKKVLGVQLEGGGALVHKCICFVMLVIISLPWAPIPHMYCTIKSIIGSSIVSMQTSDECLHI